MDYALRIHSTMRPDSVRVVTRDELALMRSGLRYSATPDGDCLEMTFEADNADLGLQPLDTVTLEGRDLGVWAPLWKGEVREGGNAHDSAPQTFKLYGLKRLLDETPLFEDAYPQADVAVIVRQALRRTINGFRLPRSITVSDVDVPLTGVDWAISRTAQQPVGALLQAASIRAGGAVYGVRADGSFYFKAPRTDTFAPPASASVEWRAPSAERPVTAVTWFYQREGDSPQAPPRTHLSTLPGALGTYGLRTRRVAVNMPFLASEDDVTQIQPRLDAWANWAYSLPSTSPARVTLSRLVLPSEYRGRVSLPTVATAERVASWETTITTARGVETHINAGQETDAGMEALAAAITRSGEQASWKGAVNL